MTRPRAGRAVLMLALALLTSAGCSWGPFRHHEPASAPVPPAPPLGVRDSTDTGIDSLAGADSTLGKRPLGLPATRPGNKPKTLRVIAAADTTKPAAPVKPVESVMTPEERERSMARAVADTSAAGQALRKCGGRQLLPDQEGVFEAVRSLLAQARTALQSGELWRAESLARKARQLGSSLNCP